MIYLYFVRFHHPILDGQTQDEHSSLRNWNLHNEQVLVFSSSDAEPRQEIAR